MEWVKYTPNQQIEEGWYVVLIGNNPHCVYYRQPQWDSGWKMPNEWQYPTHICKLASLDKWDNVKSYVTMD